MLLASASLCFGAPLLMNSVPSQGQAQPAETSAPAASAGASDGYQLTVQAFQKRITKGRELMDVLHKINAEAQNRVPGSRPKQQAYLAMKLNELYPGSTYDGVRGKIVFQKDYVATFTSTLNVDTLVELGDVTATYLLDQGQIVVTFGTNSVTAVIDSSSPSRSTFTKVVIPAMRVAAEEVLTIPGYRRTASDSVETSILNDAYQLLSQTADLRMDYFAADIMRSPKLQKKAITIARTGYLERHPQEYQRGAEPDKAPKVTDRLKGLSFGTATKFLVSILLMVVLVALFFWGARRTLAFVQMLFMDDSTREYARKYRKLMPMVLQSLRETGRSLWGRNLFWSRKYYLTRRSDRWSLSDGKVDRYNLQNLPENLIEVCLRDDNFKIHISRIRGEAADIVVRTSGCSRQELRDHLQQMKAYFTGETPVTAGVTAAPIGDGAVPR